MMSIYEPVEPIRLECIPLIALGGERNWFKEQPFMFSEIENEEKIPTSLCTKTNHDLDIAIREYH